MNKMPAARVLDYAMAKPLRIKKSFGFLLMNKKILFFVMFVFMLSSVYALGISPGRTTVDFKPGLQKTIEFEVINSGDKDMKLLLTAQGELASYVSISSDAVSVSASEHSKTLSYTVSFPNDLEPGLRTADIFVVEVPESAEAGGSAVLATLAVVTQLYVNVPYPGKFAEADLIIYDANRGGDVQFVFPVLSRGEFDLTNVRANVDVFNSVGDKVDSFNTQSVSIVSGGRKEIVYAWKADVPIGNYRAAASLIYDEGTIPLEATFSVGSKELELQEITVNSFSLGEIIKLEMLVENKWSEPIKDAHISTKIKNDRGDIVSSFDSASYDISALSKQTFVSYWDTAGVRVGDYQTEVSINYGDKSSTKNLEFQVSENNLKVVGLGYVISAEGGEGGVSSLVIVLIVVIVLLVLVNLLWFLLLRKRLKK